MIAGAQRIHWICRLPQRALMIGIRGYQVICAPWLGRCCRFYPSCSCYTYEAVNRYGALRGGFMGIRRILRCHPWQPGGVDPVP